MSNPLSPNSHEGDVEKDDASAQDKSTSLPAQYSHGGHRTSEKARHQGKIGVNHSKSANDSVESQNLQDNNIFPPEVEFFEAIEQDLLDASKIPEVEPQVLYDIASQVRNSFNLQDLFQSILEHLNPAIPYDISGGLLLPGNSPHLMFQASSEALLNAPQCQFFLKTQRTASEAVIQQIQQQLLHTLSHLSGKSFDHYHLTTYILNSSPYESSTSAIESIQSQVFVPLIVPSDQPSNTIGLLFVGAEQEHQFTEENIRLLYFAASHVSMAVQSFRSQIALEQLAGVISNLQDGVLLLDKNQTIVLSNSRGKNYLALLAEMGTEQSLTQLGGKTLDELMQCPREDPSCREVTVTDHPERVFEVVVQPISQDTQLEYWVVVLREVSDRKRFERKIQAALKKARDLSDVKSRVMRTVSHEYRSPLTTILLAAETLESRQDRLNQQQRHHLLDQIQQAASYMTKLVDDMLFVDQAESGQLQFNPIALDLNQFCRTLVEEMQVLGNHNHTLTISHQGNCDNLYMDPMLLRQILNNLLSNAIKFSPEGGVVDVLMTCGSDQVTLSVRDEGIGIPALEQTKIFQSFYRAVNVDTIEGTGLGLDITQKFVELHQGTISVESEEGIGSTFTIKFPRLSA